MSWCMSDQFSLFDDNLEPAPNPAERPAPATPPPAEAASASAPGEMAPPEPALTPEDKAARLDAIRVVAVECTRCGLSRTRTNVVFGEGNPAAPLVFVGEGPGENEDATGRPFVGRAGKLLDEVLRRNGMTRAHVHIGYVLQCAPANMDAGRW